MCQWLSPFCRIWELRLALVKCEYTHNIRAACSLHEDGQLQLVFQHDQYRWVDDLVRNLYVEPVGNPRVSLLTFMSYGRYNLHSLLCRNEGARYRSQDTAILHQPAAICGLVRCDRNFYNMLCAFEFLDDRRAEAERGCDCPVVQRLLSLLERPLGYRHFRH